MAAEPDTVAPPNLMWRVARSDDPLAMSEISPADARLKHAGNRFDTTAGGVLYGATEPLGCYMETIARFRPSAKVRAAVKDEPGFMLCGGVPADWRTRRVKVSVRLPDALPFLDVESPRTHEYLTTELALELAALKVPVLDVGVVRGADRRVTRSIATWAFSAGIHYDGSGAPLYSGIRYISRLDQQECWAVFQGALIEEVSRSTVSLSDKELQEAADLFGLRLF